MATFRTIAALGVVLLSLTAIIPGGSTAPAAAAATQKTLYLHSQTPSGNAEEVPYFAAGDASLDPTMDASPPAFAVPKVATNTLGNEAYYKNGLLAYWGAREHGSLQSVTAELYVVAAADSTLSASLLADGGSAPLANVQVPIAAGGGLQHLHLDFGAASVNVDREFILQVFTGDTKVGAVPSLLLYDSTLTPASLSFTLGDYVPPVVSQPSWTPASGWSAVTPVNVTTAHRETSLAIDPTNNDRMFLCDPSGVPNTQYGHSWFYRSDDNGASWQYAQVETSQTDGREYAFEGGDCDVAYDAAGTVYTADTWLGDLSVGHSIDHGRTWNGTPLAVTSPVVDRPWLVGGPAGTIHVTYQDVQAAMPTAIWYTRSTDYGVTFLPAVPVVVPDANHPFSWEGNFVVSQNGQDLFLVYTNRAQPALGSLEAQGSENVMVAASHDGGITWSSTKVATMPNPASFLYPSIGMDGAGWLHVVFASRTNADHPIWYSFSKDGSSWSAPRAILHGVGAYSPWIVGAGPGAAAFEWYGSTTAVDAPASDADWFFYAGRVSGADSGSPAFSSMATTLTPIFHGKQSETPEFNQVRLDAAGHIRLGESAYYGTGNAVGWAALYQAEP